MQARYPNIQFSQFMGAEMMAQKYGLTKDQLDEYAYNSHRKRDRRHAGRRLQERDPALEITTRRTAQELHHRR